MLLTQWNIYSAMSVEVNLQIAAHSDGYPSWLGQEDVSKQWGNVKMTESGMLAVQKVCHLTK